ncbi:MAG TPA: BlaI/MecI/CopY family transcriptional regulator [Gemmatimonadaceae bacterium]|nr:BlaI/MecI/CopY family transcriptional regulator [Gemmatimonadaceae bacterium]
MRELTWVTPLKRGEGVNRSSRSELPQGQPRLHDTVRLSAAGLAKVLGDLEARVLRAVWSFGKPVPARAVYQRVARYHRVSPLTVITVLNKLVHKRILAREKHDDLLHYRATMTESEFRTFASRRVMEGVLAFGPDAMAASFVDVLAERDPERLAALGRLVRRKLRDAQKGRT